jgi:DNA-binding transcriptional ArsR family regulator
MNTLVDEKNNQSFYQHVGHLLKEISPPSRIKILLMIGHEEVCVCHLEANLGMKQAYLSQHLMALRKAGVLIAVREGRYMHYRLANPQMLHVIQNTASVLGIQSMPSVVDFKNQNCACPQCKEK